MLADIPGLIEGAHEGKGLGTRFLGHVERTSVLLHLIDATQDDVLKAYKTVRHELEEYGEELAGKTEIIALNKCDAIGMELAAEQAKQLKKVAKGRKDPSHFRRRRGACAGCPVCAHQPASGEHRDALNAVPDAAFDPATACAKRRIPCPPCAAAYLFP